MASYADGSAPSAAFLRLALAPYRDELTGMLRKSNFMRKAYATFAVVGVPNATIVTVFAWPEPLGLCRRILIDVVSVDGYTLPRAVALSFDLTPRERRAAPPIEVTATSPDVQVGRVKWYKVEAKREREVQKLKADGSPHYVAVDTGEYNYMMTCPDCGRARYAKRNSLHQISLCRVCTRQERLRKRALTQYRARRLCK